MNKIHHFIIFGDESVVHPIIAFGINKDLVVVPANYGFIGGVDPDGLILPVILLVSISARALPTEELLAKNLASIGSSNVSHFFQSFPLIAGYVWQLLQKFVKFGHHCGKKNSAEVWQNFAKCWSNVHQQTVHQIVNAHFEIRGRSKGSALCRSRRELLPPRIYLQHLASRQPRPSPPTFCRSKASDTHHPRS